MFCVCGDIATCMRSNGRCRCGGSWGVTDVKPHLHTCVRNQHGTPGGAQGAVARVKPAPQTPNKPSRKKTLHSRARIIWFELNAPHSVLLHTWLKCERLRCVAFAVHSQRLWRAFVCVCFAYVYKTGDSCAHTTSLTVMWTLKLIHCAHTKWMRDPVEYNIQFVCFVCLLSVCVCFAVLMGTLYRRISVCGVRYDYTTHKALRGHGSTIKTLVRA